MWASSLQPGSADIAGELPDSPPRSEGRPLNCEYDEEFPADLPVAYDRLLQPAFANGSRNAVKVFVATGVLLFSGLSFWGVHKFPKLKAALGTALALAVIFVALRAAFSVLGSFRLGRARRDVRHRAPKALQSPNSRLEVPPFHSSSY
jgi:hypothetical protein